MGATKRLQRHLRKTLLTGIFSTIPLVVTIAVVVYIEGASREPVRALLGLDIPFIGFAVGLAVIYVVGLLVSSIVGKLFLEWLDTVLLRVPILRDLYKAWKQISLTPGGREGIYAKVVLVPDGERQVLAFTSGQPIEGDPTRCCVYQPEAPNPMSGGLFVVEIDRCTTLDISVEEAFKMLLSSGNYVPAQLGRSTAARAAPLASTVPDPIPPPLRADERADAPADLQAMAATVPDPKPPAELADVAAERAAELAELDERRAAELAELAEGRAAELASE